MRAAVVIAIVSVAPAAAEPAELAPQVHADLGLSVVGVGYERPIAGRVAVEVQGGIFGTYFLPWFDRGDDVKGLQLGARATWFARASGRGLYVAPYLRGVAVRGDLDGRSGQGFGFTAGAFAGWAIGLGQRLDLRLGAGTQWIYFDADPLGASTPFLAADILLGYRL
ncbi:MAG: hypothetical protein KBG48_03805 [Kofleriaceae bacterium]|jgi:hypothetical protein|nr:hypothetical protein [Kofleriaceae bacterium]MBP9166481.1 hypothetical protein [Kofleriaceae bacterium]MBP9860288.1 hypothetical protein [Kofleriaceae bacterium]